MRHREITQTVVAGIDRLLDQGCAYAEIAKRLAVSEYLVGVVASDKIGRRRRLPPAICGRQPPVPPRSTDAATVEMVRRMLELNRFSHRQIGREIGVSKRTVERIAVGERLPDSTERPLVFKELGERFLKWPIRCKECGAKISIAPCRACRALRS